MGRPFRFYCCPSTIKPHGCCSCSGTFSYILNNFKGDKSFNQIIRKAKMFGFIEPHPQNDLSGTDVTCKFGLLCVKRAFAFYKLHLDYNNEFS